MRDKKIDPIAGHGCGKGRGDVDPKGDIAEWEIDKRVGVIYEKRITGRMC